MKNSEAQGKQLKYRMIPVENLTANPKNARTHSDSQIKKIAKSIKEFGFISPAIVDENGLLVAGHGRLMAAKSLGMTEIPCLIAEHLTPTQLRAYMLADNRIQLDAGWDTELLKMELNDLSIDFDVSITGFEISEVDSFVRNNDIGEEENIYTSKIEAPIYTPKGIKPEIEQLYDFSKTKEIIDEIEKSNADPKLKEFLIAAAYRHTKIDFSMVAEYYAHAPKEIQTLFENQCLVVIDFNKAIELGYVELTDELAKQFKIERPIAVEVNDEDE